MRTSALIMAQRKYYEKNKQLIYNLSNQYQKNHRSKMNEYNKKRYSENELVRYKQAARRKTTSRFINRKIDLSKKICEVNGCNEHGVIHHCNYDEPMDISFVCKQHHLQIHRGVELYILRHF